MKIKKYGLLSILAAVSLNVLVPTAAGAVEVAFERDARLPVVNIAVAIRAGYTMDPTGQSGLTRFMGQMLTRGTKLRSKEQIDLELDQMGAEIGVETRAESTVLRGTVLASQLDRFLSLISEMLTQPSFPPSEIRKLKGEVTSAIAGQMGRDESVAYRKFLKYLFNKHPYGKPPLGTTVDVVKLTAVQLRAQYDRIVRDQLLLVVATGDADEAKLKTWADGIGQARPGGLAVEELAVPTNPPHRRLIIVDKPDRTETQIIIGQIGMATLNPQYRALDIANVIFGGGGMNASRLMLQIRSLKGWSYSASSSQNMARQPHQWSIHLHPAAKNSAEALAYVLGMVSDLKAKGVTHDEFQFAQSTMINNSAFDANTAKKRAENLLTEKLIGLPNGFFKSAGEQIQKVTLEQVNAAAQAFFQPNDLTILVLGTAKDLKAPLAKAAGVELSKVEVVPYTQE